MPMFAPPLTNLSALSQDYAAHPAIALRLLRAQSPGP